MKKLLAIFTLLFFSIFLVACAGSKKATDTEIRFADKEIQSQVEVLKEKIEDNPNNMEYRRQLAAVYHMNGEHLEALRILEESFALDPNNAESKFEYAEIAMSVGDRLKAFQAYKDVLQSVDGESYLSRIAPKFSDAFQSNKIIGTSADEGFGRFSNDGSKIVYQSNQNGNWDLFEYDLISQVTRQITDSPFHEENPDYSPDGKRIVYTSTEEDHRDVDYDQKLRDIFIKDFDQNREINLTTNGSNDWRPSYSDDGKYIAFVSERSDLREVPFYELFSDIFIMEHDGRFQLQLTKTEGNNGSPSILKGSSEEEGLIYFDSDRTGNFEIYRTDFKGHDVRQITFLTGSNEVSPAVSPNGDKIAFFSDRDGNYEIYLMNSDGSAEQRLTANPADDLNPIFSPEGNKIIFHSNRTGNYDIYLLDLTQQYANPQIYEVIGKIDEAIQSLR